MKELGVTIGNSNNNKTYEMMNTPNKNDIIDKSVRFLNRYILCAHEEIKLYLISTGYQNFINSNEGRFIKGTSKCSLKPLSESITSA